MYLCVCACVYVCIQASTPSTCVCVLCVCHVFHANESCRCAVIRVVTEHILL